ncbi:helix-turn-helix domain-containing protein [Aliisedimentitalea scapharcae]|uniref:Helix-turn-helix domain-containing protein n=1 Tax=Aliisedimentitalea scapharcae TaxID=1524259 RepID=A0ABZ2XXF3_9RHOB
MVRVAIASYSMAQQAAVLGVHDLLVAAGEFTEPGFEVVIVDQFERPKAFDVIILPPSMGGWPEGREQAALCEWITALHSTGALVCTVCVGAFILASTGLLNGRPATTHWELSEEFSRQFPDVKLEAERLIVDDGDLITAGGMMAWTDLGLLLIARYLGPAVMQKVAKLFLIDPGGREQSYYNLFTPSLAHGDTQIVKAQQWLQGHYRSPVTVPQIASAAGLEERTFLRRFQAATGHRPSEYLQQLRIGQARELLELTRDNIGQIAAAVGYADISSFSKLFQKITGLAPGEYRKRFALVRR